MPSPEDWHVLALALEDDITRLRSIASCIDFVVVWGNHTRSGALEEFREASTRLARILRIVERQGSEPEVFILPGPEDANKSNRLDPRSKVLENWCNDIEVQHDYWRNESSEYRNLSISQFQNYTAWSSTEMRSASPCFCGMLPGDFSAACSRNKLSIGLLALNDAGLAFLPSAGPPILHALQALHVCTPDIAAWCGNHDCALLLTTRSPLTYPSETAQMLAAEIAPTDRFAIRISSGERLRYDAKSIGGSPAMRDLTIPPIQRGYCIGQLSRHADGLSFRMWPREFRRRASGKYDYLPDQGFELDDDHGTRQQAIADRRRPYGTVANPSGVESKISSDYLAIGPHLLVRGQQVAMNGFCWTIRVDSFILGDIERLVQFCEKWESLPWSHRCLALRDRLDARLILAPPSWERSEDTLHIRIMVSKQAATRDTSADVDICADFTIGEDGDLALVEGSAVHRQRLERLLATEQGGMPVCPEPGSWWESYYGALIASDVPNHLALQVALELESARLMRAPTIVDDPAEAFIPGVHKLHSVSLSPNSAGSPLVSVKLVIEGHMRRSDEWSLCFVRPTSWRRWSDSSGTASKVLLVRSVGRFFERLASMKHGTGGGARPGRRLIAAFNELVRGAAMAFPEAELDNLEAADDVLLEEMEQRLQFLYMTVFAELRLELGEGPFGSIG